MSKYKVTIQNTTDETDMITVEADSAIVFTGKLDYEKKQVEHGMAFAGNKRIMAEVINGIPVQITSLVKEEQKKEENLPKPSGIVAPDGRPIPSSKVKN